MDTNSINRKQKGLTLLPNILTTMSLFCGFFALISAIKGNFTLSAWSIVAAACFDGLDGRVARLTGTSSKFGVEYDSLSDLVAFGVAPAVLAYLWGLQGYGRLGWLAAFLYVATTALRLARFNALTHSSKSPSRYFLGLPCPSAAGIIATAVTFSQFIGLIGPVKTLSFLIMVYILSFLMVSSVRYYSFKDLKWFEQHPFYSVVLIILILIVIAVEPRVTLFTIGILYGVSGPAIMALRGVVPIKSRERAIKNEG